MFLWPLLIGRRGKGRNEPQHNFHPSLTYRCAAPKANRLLELPSVLLEHLAAMPPTVSSSDLTLANRAILRHIAHTASQALHSLRSLSSSLPTVVYLHPKLSQIARATIYAIPCYRRATRRRRLPAPPESRRSVPPRAHPPSARALPRSALSQATIGRFVSCVSLVYCGAQNQPLRTRLAPTSDSSRIALRRRFIRFDHFLPLFPQ